MKLDKGKAIGNVLQKKEMHTDEEEMVAVLKNVTAAMLYRAAIFVFGSAFASAAAMPHISQNISQA